MPTWASLMQVRDDVTWTSDESEVGLNTRTNRHSSIESSRHQDNALTGTDCSKLVVVTVLLAVASRRCNNNNYTQSSSSSSSSSFIWEYRRLQAMQTTAGTLSYWIGRDIIFEVHVFQPMWSRYLNVTDGQTDHLQSQNHALCSIAR